MSLNADRTLCEIRLNKASTITQCMGDAPIAQQNVRGHTGIVAVGHFDREDLLWACAWTDERLSFLVFAE